MLTSRAAIHVGSPEANFPLEEDVQIVHFHGFSDLPKKKKDVIIESPEFSCAGHKWMLRLYPGGRSNSSDGMVSVFLVSMLSWKIEVDFDIVIKKASGDNFTVERTSYPEEFSVSEGKQSKGWPNYIRLERILGEANLLKHGALIFEVRIRPHPDYVCRDARPQVSLGEDISKLIFDEESADVAFQVKGQIFYAHRLILKARTPDLFVLCDTCDKVNPLPVDDVEPDIFETMLRHAYGESVHPNDWKIKSASIRAAAGKYGFGSLKMEADAWHVKNHNLTTDNVIDFLLHADAHDLKLAKKAALVFILDNVDDVIQSESYERLYESPTLMKEVVTSMSKQITQLKSK